jgi:outer membrane protein
MRWRIYGIGLFFFLFFLRPVFAEEPPATSGRLTLKEAIRVALDHHPSLLAARGAAQAQEARVGETRALFFPQLNLNSNYTRATANFAPSSQFGSLNRAATSGTSSNSFNNYSAGLSLQQRIYDFGKTGADVEVASKGLEASRWDEETFRQNVVLNVKVDYFGLLQARRLVQVNEETVQQFEQHLQQVEGFYQVGTRARFDVTTAEVGLTNAQLNLIKARNAARVAQVTLANAMGVPDRLIEEMEDVLGFQKFEISEDRAIQEALAHRPDLLSQSAQQQAAKASVRSAVRNYFPILSGTADYTYRGQDFPLVWNWDVGLGLTFSIFSGYLTQSQVEEARANLTAVSANEEVLRQNILLEVRQDYLNLLAAEEAIRTSEVVVRQAKENLDLANGRFQAGVGTSVEQTDAQVTLTNAKTAQVQALSDYKVAGAQLEKAMGREE